MTTQCSASRRTSPQTSSFPAHTTTHTHTFLHIVSYHMASATTCSHIQYTNGQSFGHDRRQKSESIHGRCKQAQWTSEEGCPINKLQNRVILLVFQNIQIRNIHFVGNLIMCTSCKYYYDDVTVMQFININYESRPVTSSALLFIFVGKRT